MINGDMMAEARHLNNAPITEAILDIRLRLPTVEASTFLSLHTKIAEKYPNKQERRKFEGQIVINEDQEPQAKNVIKEVDGYLFRSPDNKQIVQFRLDGFTLNRLKPYGSWETFRDEAKRLWNLYLEAASPEQITRIALRYINHLFLPGPIVNFDDYLTAGPVVPEKLPQGVSSFLTRVVIHEPTIKASAIITQALEKIIQPDIVPIILDIDVIREGDFDLNYLHMWETFEKLRDFKNRIFFESVTEKALELFQ